MSDLAARVENIARAPLRLLGCGSREQFETVLAEYAGRIRGVLAYAAVEPARPETAFPYAWIPLPVMGGDAWYEVWVSAQPVTLGGDTRLAFSRDRDLLFGSMVLAETAPDELESGAFEAYAAIFDALDREGYPELLRAWNYFPRINDAGRGLERYREFNMGRHAAFCDRGRRIGAGSVPAACALGTRQGDMVVCFLASKLPGVAIENPRQTSAYRYPPSFGPRSPTFSRGVLVAGALLISGTASIIGSETAHPEDVVRQLEVTLENLRLVVEQGRACGFAARDPARLHLNVYLRHAEDYPDVRNRLDAEFGDAAHVVYLQADVCRADLLVEIEAFWMADA